MTEPKVSRKISEIDKIGFISLILLLLLIAATIIIVKHTFAKNFIQNQTELPPDIKESLEKISESSLSTNSKTQYTPEINIPILLYHYVEYVQDKGDTIRQSLNIEPFILDQQIKTLKENEYTFITPSQIPDILAGRIKSPPKPIILSFDDGYRDFYTDVFPILKKYQIKAVIYLVTSFLDKPNNLTHQQVKDILASKLVEVGAHTVHHSYLRDLPAAKTKYEIEESKKNLEDAFGIFVTSFAYPYGAFDLQAVQTVKDNGFTNAVSTIPGIKITSNNLFFIYRIRVGKRVGQNLLQFLSQPNFSSYSAIINPVQKKKI